MISRVRISGFLLFAAASSMCLACQKVPLLAPSGSTITITSAATALPLNGTADIVAQLIEPAGTPPHRGTQVTFTTTLGSIQPVDAETDENGRVTAKFSAGNVSGTATITASSGGVNVGSSGAVKIAVGAAAVGRVAVSASPGTVAATGGTSTISASVIDLNGNALPGAAVTFTTSAGTLSPGVVNTDQTGTAQSVLTTNKEATVTATAGLQVATGGTSSQSSATVMVKVNAPASITVGAPSPSTAIVNQTVTFPVTYGTGANYLRVTVDYGDGASQSINGMPATIAHAYSKTGTFVARVTGTDAFGDTQSGASSSGVVVASNKPTMTQIQASPSNPMPNTTITFSTTITPAAGTTIDHVVWNFGDGDANQQMLLGNAGSTSHRYGKESDNNGFKVTATATDSEGQSTSTSTIVIVKS